VWVTVSEIQVMDGGTFTKKTLLCDVCIRFFGLLDIQTKQGRSQDFWLGGGLILVEI